MYFEEKKHSCNVRKPRLCGRHMKLNIRISNREHCYRH